MSAPAMTATGTIQRVPRKPDALPDDKRAAVAAAADRYRQAQADAKDEMKAAVIEACKWGSRQAVADATKISKTTIQAWVNGQDR